MRRLAVWLAVWLAVFALVAQSALTAGATERAMSPVQGDSGALLVICSADGAHRVADGGLPGNIPAHHHSQDCPCCLPFAPCSGGVLLPVVPAVQAPRLASTMARVPVEAAAPALRLLLQPHQSRAPPLSV